MEEVKNVEEVKTDEPKRAKTYSYDVFYEELKSALKAVDREGTLIKANHGFVLFGNGYSVEAREGDLDMVIWKLTQVKGTVYRTQDAVIPFGLVADVSTMSGNEDNPEVYVSIACYAPSVEGNARAYGNKDRAFVVQKCSVLIRTRKNFARR